MKKKRRVDVPLKFVKGGGGEWSCGCLRSIREDPMSSVDERKKGGRVWQLSHGKEVFNTPLRGKRPCIGLRKGGIMRFRQGEIGKTQAPKREKTQTPPPAGKKGREERGLATAAYLLSRRRVRSR